MFKIRKRSRSELISSIYEIAKDAFEKEHSVQDTHKIIKYIISEINKISIVTNVSLKSYVGYYEILVDLKEDGNLFNNYNIIIKTDI